MRKTTIICDDCKSELPDGAPSLSLDGKEYCGTCLTARVNNFAKFLDADSRCALILAWTKGAMVRIREETVDKHM